MSDYRPCAFNQYMTNMRIALMGDMTKPDPFAGRMLARRQAQVTAELDRIRKTRQFPEFQKERHGRNQADTFTRNQVYEMPLVGATSGQFPDPLCQIRNVGSQKSVFFKVLVENKPGRLSVERKTLKPGNMPFCPSAPVRFIPRQAVESQDSVYLVFHSGQLLFVTPQQAEQLTVHFNRRWRDIHVLQKTSSQKTGQFLGISLVGLGLIVDAGNSARRRDRAFVPQSSQTTIQPKTRKTCLINKVNGTGSFVPRLGVVLESFKRSRNHQFFQDLTVANIAQVPMLQVYIDTAKNRFLLNGFCLVMFLQ